jgi:hypothetical protein
VEVELPGLELPGSPFQQEGQQQQQQQLDRGSTPNALQPSNARGQGSQLGGLVQSPELLFEQEAAEPTFGKENQQQQQQQQQQPSKGTADGKAGVASIMAAAGAHDPSWQRVLPQQGQASRPLPLVHLASGDGAVEVIPGCSGHARVLLRALQQQSKVGGCSWDWHWVVVGGGGGSLMVGVVTVEPALAHGHCPSLGTCLPCAICWKPK